MPKANTSLNGNSPAVSVEDLSAQINTLKSDLAGLTNALQEYGVAKADAATTTAKAKAAELKAVGQEKATEAQLHAEEFVRTQPATALGLAAGLGFVIGMITVARR